MRIGRNTAVLPKPMSSYATIAFRLTLFPRIKVGECMCQKVKFWCILLSFWIVLISISDKCISGLPEILFFKILRLRDSPKACFSRFRGFGTPRKLVFKILRLRGIPKACFSRFRGFGVSWRLIFQENNSLGLPETLFFRISASLTCPHDRQRTFPNVSSDNNKPNRCFHRYLEELRAAH